jgi:type IV pilus assembly protein PilB
MSTEQAQVLPSGLARRLVRDRLITEQQAQNAHIESARRRQPLIQYLVVEKVLDSRSIAIAAS